MQPNQEYPNFPFLNQPSFNFQHDTFGWLEPQFENLHLSDRIEEEIKPSGEKVIKEGKGKRRDVLYRKKIRRLEIKVKELEREVKELRKEKKREMGMEKQISMQRKKTTCQNITPTSSPPLNLFPNPTSLRLPQLHPTTSLQFHPFQLTPHPPLSPQPASPTPQPQLQLSGQSWIIMGMLMMVMGININGYDGSIDAYKITRQTVDSIRRQVEKSHEEILFPVFYSKLFSVEGGMMEEGMEGRGLEGCFELEGLRVESIDEEDLMFEQHLGFRLKYEALIVMMEYMKQYASLG